MASGSLKSTSVEFSESGIKKPSPLRIIKRSKTISGGSSSREAIGRGRPASGSSNRSQGSPPLGKERPLTVRRKRAGRSSVFDSSFDDNDDVLVTPTDLDTTPRAPPSTSRIPSDMAGMFLKAELRYPSTTTVEYPDRVTRSSSFSDIDVGLRGAQHQATPEMCDVPQRKMSKSKNFLLKAIGGRGAPQKVKLKKEADAPPKDTLIRRISRSRRLKDSWSSNGSQPSLVKNANISLDAASRDITDTMLNAQTHSEAKLAGLSSSSSPTEPLVFAYGNLILTPQISVTPERPVVDCGNCTFWVAIEISGVLQHPEPSTATKRKLSRSSIEPLLSETFGYLHSIDIELLLAPHCFLTDLVGDLHDVAPIRAGQTRLLLAKISLGKLRPTSSHHSASSADLFADLETHLGNTYQPYLTVRLSYEHSGFRNAESVGPGLHDKGSCVTHLQTDNVSLIRRHDRLSTWSPRASQAEFTTSKCSPLIQIARQHLPIDEANDFIARITSENVSYPFSRKSFAVEGYSDDTVMAPDNAPIPTMSSSIIHTPFDFLELSKEPLTRSQSVQNAINPLPRLPDPTRTLSDETDPARRIWSEMRRSSRGRPSLYDRWGTCGKDGFIDNDLTPEQKDSFMTTFSNFRGRKSRDSSQDSGRRFRGNSVDYERNMLMEIALKNKRSLGAETLRSMAPSIAKGAMRSKQGSVAGLGLGSGRTWGWGSPWW